MLSIHTNFSSSNATKHVKHAHLNRNSSIEKLSTGKRINAAKDDPAGLAISMRLSAQVQGLKKASENIAVSQSFLDYATDAYSRIETSIIKMKELTLQAANGTIDDVARSSISTALGELGAHIKSISEQSFNGGNVAFDGVSKVIQVGANSGDTMIVEANAKTTDILSSSPQNVINAKTKFDTFFSQNTLNMPNEEDIREALRVMSQGQAYLGSFVNVLESVSQLNNLNIILLDKSKGNIEDTDFALETTKLAKHQISEQAGIAIAAQANASASIVLQLIN